MTDGTITDKRTVDVEFIHDLFQPFGAVTVRRMFGGAGLFANGVMFGLVSGGQIYLKADATTVVHRAPRRTDRQFEEAVRDRQRRRTSHVRPRALHHRLSGDDPIAPAYAVSLAPATQTDGGRPGTTVNYPLSVKNLGFTTDSYTLSSSGGTDPVAFFDSTCTTPATTTPAVAPGATAAVCVKVTAGATGTNTATVTATSAGSPGVTATASIKTIAVTVRHLLVDNDGNAPGRAGVLLDGPDGGGSPFEHLGPRRRTRTCRRTTCKRAQERRLVHRATATRRRSGPYEATLQAFLDGGGRLLDVRSGHPRPGSRHDGVRARLPAHHVGRQRRRRTTRRPRRCTAWPGNPVTNGIGTVPLDHIGACGADVRGPDHAERRCADRRSPTTHEQPDALSFSGTYKVVFLAFPFEAYGTAAREGRPDQPHDDLLRAVSPG